LQLIIVEYLAHAGKENGNIRVPQKDFIEVARIDIGSVAPALRRLEAKGFIAIAGGEFNPGTGYRNPLKFTLTFRCSIGGKADIRPTEKQKRDKKASVPCRWEKPQNPVGKTALGPVGKTALGEPAGKPALPSRRRSTIPGHEVDRTEVGKGPVYEGDLSVEADEPDGGEGQSWKTVDDPDLVEF
jgi:hypothetical protein